MALSLTYLGLVVLSLFLSNFLLVRAYRNYVDVATKWKNETNIDDTPPKMSFKMKILNSNVLLVILGPLLWLYLKVERKLEQLQTADENDRDKTLEMILAFCFGFLRKQNFEERRFPKWVPLPYKFGAVTTSALVIIFSILFSEKVLNKTLGLDPTGTNPTATVCTNENMDSKVDQIIDKFLDTTNFVSAMNQLQVTTMFLEALQNDTSLWGEPGHECDLNLFDPELRTKVQFQNSERYGREGGLSFFPGMCNAVQEKALEAVRSQTCSKEICNTGHIVDPDSIKAVNGKITGLDALQGQVDNVKNSLKDIKPTCDNCPNSIAGLGRLGTKAVFGGGIDFGLGVSGVDEAIEALDGIDVSDTIDITAATSKFEFKDEAFCKSYTVPCPDFSRYDELTQTLKDYSFEKLDKFSKAAVELTAPAVSYGRATVSEQYVNFVKTLIKQMEIAGFLYAGYTCLTLFFPSPLIIFKASILSNIRSIIFGARKYTFIASSLALWWGVQFFRSFKFVKYFEVYMKVFLQDPCVARQDYLAAIGGNYSTVCHSMLSAQSEWSNANKTIHDILHISEPMVSTCCGPYPYKNLNISIFTDNDSGHEAAMKEYGFDYDKSGGSFCRDVVGCKSNA